MSADLKNRGQTLDTDTKNRDQDHDQDLDQALSSQTEQFTTSQLVLYLIPLRLLNALTINTFFQPDEYYQSLEPAHFRHFGYGTLTWEWQIGLRSYLHPLIYDLGFYLVDLLRTIGWIQGRDVDELAYEEGWYVWIIPRLINVGIAVCGEVALYRLIGQWSRFNEKVSRLALFCSVTSVWNWFMITRSFGNSVEMSLFCVALRYWPWDGKSVEDIKWGQFRASLLLACACCIIRPTNGLIWVILGLELLSRAADWTTKLQIIANVAITGVATLGLNTLIDYWFYQSWTFPLWNFLKFNALTPLSEFYGRNDWHFHLSQSVPLMLMLFLPFFVLGVLQNFKQHKVLKFIIAANLAMFSCIKHKEFRFIYPLQPFLIFFTAMGLQRAQILLRSYFKHGITLILIINTLLSLYLTQEHERAPIDLLSHFQETSYDIKTIGFLTPCHSTPLQSILHNPLISTWSVTCEPPLHLLHTNNLTTAELSSQLASYKDQSDQFYQDPATWLYQNLPPFPFAITSHPYHRNSDLRQPGREYTYEWPSHLVFFEPLETVLKEYLEGSLYVECERFGSWDGGWHWDDRRTGDLIVWCLPHYY